jgi:hypothetical protein
MQRQLANYWVPVFVGCIIMRVTRSTCSDGVVLSAELQLLLSGPYGTCYASAMWVMIIILRKVLMVRVMRGRQCCVTHV